MYTLKKIILHIRKQKPLICNLTNFVTMEFVANCLLALGAAPIMTLCEEELDELVRECAALYLNMGTIDNTFISLIKKAILLAKKYKKPIIFDPAGTGATHIRSQIARQIAPQATIVRGNASEILSLSEITIATKGVEATHHLKEVPRSVVRLARKQKNTLIISGPIDFITDGTHSAQVHYGTPIMAQVTGMGCALTAIIAAFISVLDHPFDAGMAALYYFTLCGEIAARSAFHSGSFKHHFIDQLHSANFKHMQDVYDKRRKNSS